MSFEEQSSKLSRRSLIQLAGGSLLAASTLGCLHSEAEQPVTQPDRFSHEQPNPQAPLRELKDKVAFITGGSSGVGLGIARACYEEGMKVVISYLTEAHAQEAKEEYFADAGERFLMFKLDVTDRQRMVEVADEIEAAFGHIHLLVNNAGVANLSQVGEASYNDWDFILGVNLGGVINGVHTFVPRMRAHGEPAQVVATSSIAGHMAGGYPNRGGGVYTTSKFAVVGLMESLRQELHETNIGVSVFCPGPVQSRIRRSDRNRPEHLRDRPAVELTEEERSRQKEMESQGMDPLESGRLVLRGVKRNDLYIFSHPEYADLVQERLEAIQLSFPTPPVDIERRRPLIYGPEVARLKQDHGIAPD